MYQQQIKIGRDLPVDYATAILRFRYYVHQTAGILLTRLRVEFWGCPVTKFHSVQMESIEPQVTLTAAVRIDDHLLTKVEIGPVS